MFRIFYRWNCWCEVICWLIETWHTVLGSWSVVKVNQHGQPKQVGLGQAFGKTKPTKTVIR